MATVIYPCRCDMSAGVVHLALYQPDIPQNLGALIRLSACLGLPLHVIEPCGFPLDDRRMRRAAMDYYDKAAITRHADWPAFLHQIAEEKDASTERASPLVARSALGSSRGPVGQRGNESNNPRLILLTTRASQPYTAIAYRRGDILLFGRESAGAPEEVHQAADLRVTIPMQPGCRSLNLALSAAMVAGEALRQLL